MRSGVAVGRWVAGLIASILMLLVGPAASAWGDAKVRFVHDDPGWRAPLELTRPRAASTSGSGAAGLRRRSAATRTCPPATSSSSSSSADGRVHLHGQRAAPEPGPLHRRRHERQAARWCSGTAAPRAASRSLRVVQAAPELGRVDVRLGDEPVAEGVGFGDVAPYTPVAPGAYALQRDEPEGRAARSPRAAP